LAPDGDLTRLPFEVLPLETGGHLIDTYHISYLSVGRDVLRRRATGGRPSSDPLVIADPDYDLGWDPVGSSSAGDPEGAGAATRALPMFHRLTGTAEEGRQVAERLGVEPLLGTAALEHTIKQHSSPRIMHIATHGFFLSAPDPVENGGRAAGESFPTGATGRLADLARLENPLLRSGLVLAGANTWLVGLPLPPAAEDGLLTADDVTGLDLLSTELVVLSACETGLGEIATGEGVFGLRRAFMLAGAETLVMTLWKVPDLLTRELMVGFYRRVLAGRRHAAALRDAQRALKTRFPDPLYWGAFICQSHLSPRNTRRARRTADRDPPG
jgi:CHAT domain-containing protein